MSTGYGRGYYGTSQLAPKPRRKNWFNIAAVVGLGAAGVWFLWPRITASKETATPQPLPSSPTPVTPAAAQPQIIVVSPAEATGAFLKQVEDDARERGFLTVKDYEDAVVNTAKELQATGAKVVLAPHLQHLAPRLAGDETRG